ncbi:putative glucose transporter rco-3 [Elsinoe australis]|uniref:Putative glucose transporter rco-3 n=1 Tax=Elsinoe australis TaxID=40998 RepID=A0A4U7AZA8_9PEZI|nr:putative glucose transporter rco-3 [Elsinoe australis]
MKLSIKRPEGEVGAAWPAICIGLFVAFGGVLFGYDTGTISGIQEMEYWITEFEDPAARGRISLIVSVLSIGTFVGALSAGYVADIIGRRWGLIFACMAPFNLGVALQTAATEDNMFIVGRFFAGYGVGLVSAQIPMYQSETLPKWIRGPVVGPYQLAITIGLFLAALVNYATRLRNDSGSYGIPLAVSCSSPETPRYLIKTDKHEAAAKSLSRLRRLPVDHETIQEELAEFEAAHRYEMSIGQSGWIELITGPVKKRLFTGVALQALQQLAGINFIIYFGTTFFRRAGFGEEPGQVNPFIIQVIVNTVNVVSTLPGLWAVEALGRRTLLLIGAIGMGVTQYIVAILGVTVDETNRSGQNALIAFVCFFIFFFAASWGPVAWVVTGEIFPLRYRAKGLSITTATNWSFNWLLAFITPYLVQEQYANIGTNVFWIWGGFCWLAVAFVYFFIYETKGLSLEEVDALYQTVNKAWKSRAYRPAVKFSEVERSGSLTGGQSFAQAAEQYKRKQSLVESEKDAATVERTENSV